MGKSFVDTDLLESDDLSVRTYGGSSAAEAAEHLARQKEQIQDQVADAAEEIERLQMRQKELEQARQALRELHRKQHSYEEGKRDLLEKLNRSTLQLQKDEVRLTRALELVTVTRKSFGDLLGELRAIREDEWSEAGFETSLDTALALLENMRGVYNTSTARLAAQGLEKPGPGGEASATLGWERLCLAAGWGVCFRAAVAFALALGVVGGLLLGGYLLVR